ncbi:hypothetical protein TSOC_010422 [Tetrabaena socialis]|uniref:Uncharacterized protein n=1 Tax=Tetrabaena socialis TaxID=47790 RepID=A0A2J7ZTC9_9CHLO|nr:hypothetical protein TSOC_010422 [Tetrabaena socialis]|eukprot:PNH03512.1 hypothetical protein TSOC_010422 [Tetrabaena socialis]
MEAAGATGASTSGAAQWTGAVPEDLFGTAVALDQRQRITEEEPVLVITLDEAALQQRQAQFPGTAINKRAVAAIVTQHMQEVPDVFGGPSRLLFRGNVYQYQAAVNALCFTPWVRPMGEQHIGKMYAMWSATVIVALAAPFNA